LGVLGQEKYRGEGVEEKERKKFLEKTFGATANRRVGDVSDRHSPRRRR